MTTNSTNKPRKQAVQKWKLYHHSWKIGYYLSTQKIVLKEKNGTLFTP